MLTIEEATTKIKADMAYVPPEGRTTRLLVWLDSYGVALYSALRALPADEQTAIGLDGIRVVDTVCPGTVTL